MHALQEAQMTTLSYELWLYDNAQHGWEQEPNGFEANAKHTLVHLSKNLVKDFSDETILAKEIAPDSVFYALRLARWNSVLPLVTAGQLEVEDTHLATTQATAERLPGLSLHQAGYIAATAALARHVHGYDHAKDLENTVAAQPPAVREVGGLLLYSAQLQAEQADFDLESACNNRLVRLRNLFGIAYPTVVETENGSQSLSFE